MKKIDILKSIQEMDLSKTNSNLQSVNQELETFKNNIKQLTDMGVLDEKFETSMEGNSPTDFYVNIIDNLMLQKFRLTYFHETDKSEQKPISKMSEDEVRQIKEKWRSYGKGSDLPITINYIKQGLSEMSNGENLDTVAKHPLRRAYLFLQDSFNKKLSENFVNSKMFTILAEAETPKITKKEIIGLLKRKK